MSGKLFKEGFWKGCRQCLTAVWRFSFCGVRNGGSLRSVVSYQRRGFELRLLIPVLCILALALGVIGYLLKIQFLDHEKHLAAADRKLGFRQQLLGVRGEILDCNGQLLAGNMHTVDLYSTPQIVTRVEDGKYYDEFCEFLAVAAEMPLQKVKDRMNRGLARASKVTVAEEVASDLCMKVLSLHLDGVIITEVPKLTGEAPQENAEKLYKIDFVPRIAEDKEVLSEVVMALDSVLDLAPGELMKKVQKCLNKETPVLLSRRVSPERYQKIREAFQEWNRIPSGKKEKTKIPGNAIHSEETTVRCYPQGRMLANLLGYCDYDGKRGLSGIERLMNPELTGRKDYRHLVLDGKTFRQKVPSVVFRHELNGASVYLTIDWTIQQVVESGMQELVEKHQPKRAYAAMMDPHTGAILALYQYPNFDPNETHLLQGDSKEFHALVSGYEPGSIMKGISVSSSIDYGNLSIDKIVDCEGGVYSYAGSKAIHEHGNLKLYDLTIQEVIQKSSNVGSAKLVIDVLGEKNYYKYLLAFGMGQKTFVGYYPQGQKGRFFNVETRGILKPVEKWYKADVPRISIGHSIFVSPFQMLQAYGALANGGTMMQPYLVSRVVDAEGKETLAAPSVKSRPISAASAQKIISCLMTVTQKGGTATSAAVPGYHVAGKTGTAIKVDEKTHRYDSRRNTASFIGFVPAEKPAFVLLITADEPSGRSQFGGSVCGETFSKIAAQTLKLMQIPAIEEEAKL